MDSKAMLVAAVGRLLDAGMAAGTLRGDVLPLDVLVAVTGVAWATEAYGDQDQVDRLLDFILDSYVLPQFRK